MLTTSEYLSPLGTIVLWFYHDDLCALQLPGTDMAAWVAKKISTGSPKPQSIEFRYRAALESYFRKRQPLEWPGSVYFRGTDFQNRVWSALMTVPFGKVVTYGELAGEIGTSAYQAVGQAVGANPIPLVIPCHRVIGASGLGGFSAGLAVKRFLLEWERSLSQVPGMA